MTSVLKVKPEEITFVGDRLRMEPSKTLDNLKIASEVLHKDEVVAFPTETVYGLGANAQSTKAVARIYEAKNRPADNPLIVHVSSRSQIQDKLRTAIPPIYDQLIEKFWPGPLTILLPLPADSPISPLCTKGQSTFGCRMPKHPVARALIDISGLPLAAPSANASTRPSCTEARHVLEDLDGRVPLILDGGAADVGVESTVVDGLVTPPRVLRPGGVSVEDVRRYGGPEWENVLSEVSASVPDGVSVRAPGMKYKHYSPRARVVLIDATVPLTKITAQTGAPRIVAVLRGLHLNEDDLVDAWPNTQIVDLPLGRTKKDISHNLFSRFREADEAGADLIIVEAVDSSGEGLAIMNRLSKAAETYLRA